MGSNPENQEQDEAMGPNTDAKTKQQEEGNEASQGKDNANKEKSDKSAVEGIKTQEPPKSTGFVSPAKTPSIPANPSTPACVDTPGQSSTTPAPTTPSAVHHVPVQPYGYPPYPYYHPLPAYMPPPGLPMGIPPHQPDPMMTSATNPYQYTDVANLHDPVPDTRRNRGGVTEPFPEKLHRMLEYAEREGKGSIVSFFAHGRAFAIHKPRRFVKEIMPKFFRQTRLTSFQRQLNLYGFRRISQGPDNGGYYHELFLQGRPGLCVNMKRTKVKGASKLKRDPESEPNFYTYPPIKSNDGRVGTPGSHTSPASQGRPPATPAAVMYPGYPYPPPPYAYTVPITTTAPYTAAQQPNTTSAAATTTTTAVAHVYPYPPPYYAYPYMYPPPPPGHAPPAPHSTPQTSPKKGAETFKTPVPAPVPGGSTTPGSGSSATAKTANKVSV